MMLIKTNLTNKNFFYFKSNSPDSYSLDLFFLLNSNPNVYLVAQSLHCQFCCTDLANAAHFACAGDGIES